MKIRLIQILIINLFINYSYSQNNEGYFGKKMYISFENIMHSPILYNVFSEATCKVDNNLNPKRDWFNWGFRIDYGYILKRNKAISFETGIDYFQIYPNDGVQNYNCYYNTFNKSDNPLAMSYGVKQEPFDIRSFIFIPKLELAIKNALLPLGLTHQIGLGFSSSKVKERVYNTKAQTSVPIYQFGSVIGYNISDSTNHYQKYVYDFSNTKPMINYILVYAIGIRAPISKNLMIHYGIRYTLNFHWFIPTVLTDYYNPYFYNHSEMRKLIAKERGVSILNFNLGLTYVFNHKSKSF